MIQIWTYVILKVKVSGFQLRVSRWSAIPGVMVPLNFANLGLEAPHRLPDAPNALSVEVADCVRASALAHAVDLKNSGI